MSTNTFSYTDDRFADIQLLRYQLPHFESFPLRTKLYIYCLSQATLYGRDITFDQFGRYNLVIRKTLEGIYTQYKGDREAEDFKALEVYLKRVWFSNGIYHHYGCEKFVPEFTESFFRKAVEVIPDDVLPLAEMGGDKQHLLEVLVPVIFRADLLAKRVNKADGVDLIETSACNFYEGVTQAEVEQYYAQMKGDNQEPPSYGLNSTLVKKGDQLEEDVWHLGGKYGRAIERIIDWLNKAKEYADTEQQRQIISLLVDYYTTGDLRTFDQYSIAWVNDQDITVDFINGFIEVYGDPLGFKGSWEGIVEYKDEEATKRTRKISANAQWFEDHSPVDPRFRKPVVKGVTANAVCAAMLGGDEYPSTAIGINLPNADWIRAKYGSKSVTITNLTHAYSQAAKGNGFLDEFVPDAEIRKMIDTYGDLCDDLHTDLHECLGHGSGQLLPRVSSDALKNYGNTIEEARADLFGLYYIADQKLVELGLLPNLEAYKAQYYEYMLNGLLTQLVRIKPHHQIEEAHMRNRALIARWALDLAGQRQTGEKQAVELLTENGRTSVCINDYEALREIFAYELAEIQRIKSEGDYDAARQLVETYAVKVDEHLHAELLSRYEQLHIAPYKGFLNPVMKVQRDAEGQPTDVLIDYSEGYVAQMLRYSTEYATLI